MKCPICEGKKGWWEGPEYPYCYWVDCTYCDGQGKLGLFKWLSHVFWENVPECFIEWCYDWAHREE